MKQVLTDKTGGNLLSPAGAVKAGGIHFAKKGAAGTRNPVGTSGSFVPLLNDCETWCAFPRPPIPGL